MENPARPSAAIRPAVPGDCPSIAAIYNHYILNTVTTFEEEPVDAAAFAARIAKVQSHGLPWLVAEEENELLGYTYASPWHARSAFRHTVEVSVYLAPSRTGRGLGTSLYEALFHILRNKNIHVVIGGLTLPNPASEALHQKFGMKKVAHFKEVGFKFDQWLDVGYWQAELEA